jgi:tRNA G18 (ribose-2'-O)-methylase SpoU
MIRKLEFEEIQQLRPALEEADSLERFPVAVMAENIRSLYNVGSIFRTSDGAGIEKLYLGGYTGCPPRKEIEKTALGSTESVCWQHQPEPLSCLEQLKAEGHQLVVLEHTDKSVPYNRFEYNFPLCFIIGNEVEGISQPVCSLADYAVEIPMHGIKQSLNVAVAYGIAIYHIIAYYKRHGVSHQP